MNDHNWLDRPGRLRLTDSGKAVSVVSLASLLAAWIFGWLEFVIVGFGAMAALVAGVIWVWRPTTLQVSRQVASRRVAKGQPITEVLRVSNPGRLPVAPRTVIEQVGARRVLVRIPRIGAGATYEARLTHATPGRGLLHLGPTHVDRIDPLGLVAHEAQASQIERVIVHPPVHPVSIEPSVSGGDLDSTTPSSRHRGGAFRGVRSYETGDDMRSVHWRSTAKQGELMVRQLGDTSEGRLAVILDTHHRSYPSADAFEAAVEIAASLLAEAARQDLEVVFGAGATRPGTASLLAFSPASRFSNPFEHLDACAAVELQDHLRLASVVEQGFGILTSGSAGSSTAGSCVIVVTGVEDDAFATGLAGATPMIRVIRSTGRASKDLLAEWSAGGTL